MEEPVKGFFRLSPGKEVRLRHAYIIRCEEVIKDREGNIQELRCTYDRETPIGENPSDGRKVKGVIHWVSIEHALPIRVRCYDRLFTQENLGDDYLDHINPNALTELTQAYIEPSLKGVSTEEHFQFERHGFFVTDLKDSKPDALVFNQTVSLKDSWAKKTKEQPKQKERKKGVQKNASTQPEYTPEVEALAQKIHEKHEIPLDYASLLAQDQKVLTYFEEGLKTYSNPKALANWVINELLREIKHHGEPPFQPCLPSATD